MRDWKGLAISGKAGSGKSAFARLLVDVLAAQGQEARVLSFAGPLKAECELEWGIRKEDVGGREALARYGDMKRAVDPDYFLKLLLAQIRSLQAAGVFPIVDDMRLAHEYDSLKAEHFFLLRLVAPRGLREVRVRARGDDPAVCGAATRYECELDGGEFEFTGSVLTAHPSEAGLLKSVAWFAYSRFDFDWSAPVPYAV